MANVVAPTVGNGLWSFAAQAPNQWFGPGVPLPPMAQEQALGRAYDFATGYNFQIQPKPYEGITFNELRNIADGYDLLRLVIETRKDQLEKLTWTIKKRGEKITKKGVAPDPRIEKIKDFLAYPDQEHTFGTWIRMLCEDLFVLDAPAVYVRRTKGGSLFALDVVDGATIKRVLDPTGRTPLDGPAYQQVIKGVIACEYTRDELIYMPRNPRPHRAFGFSPVEQVVTTVNIALRRQLQQLSYYTDGNTPNLIFGVPKEWTSDQIRKYQEWWDSLMLGNTQQRQRARFVPGEVKPFDTKEHALKDEYDEWLARIVCFAFSVAPSALVKDSNKATAETVQGNAWAEGQAPAMNWVKTLLDRILRNCFDAPDLEAVPEDERAMVPMVQSQRDAADISSGVRTVNECREDRGLEALPEPEPVVPPVIPPPPPGTVATPEGQSVLPDKNQPAAASTDEPSTEAGDTKKPVTAAKLAKAKKVIKPIRRDRATLKKLQAKLKKVVSSFLTAQVQPIAQLLHDVMPESAEKLAKMSREEALKMLEAVDFDWTKLGDDLEPILAAIAQDGAVQGLVQVGSKTTAELLDQVNEKAVEWAEKHAADLVTQLADTTKTRLRGDLAASIELGMSVQDIAAVLEKDYEFSEQRAELVANTERAFADVRGNCIGYAESGVVGGLEWVTANEGDEKVCPDCEMNDGASVPMDEDGNATEPFPDGSTTAPGHPECRCDLLPQLKDDTTTETEE